MKPSIKILVLTIVFGGTLFIWGLLTTPYGMSIDTPFGASLFYSIGIMLPILLIKFSARPIVKKIAMWILSVVIILIAITAVLFSSDIYRYIQNREVDRFLRGSELDKQCGVWAPRDEKENEIAGPCVTGSSFECERCRSTIYEKNVKEPDITIKLRRISYVVFDIPQSIPLLSIFITNPSHQDAF